MKERIASVSCRSSRDVIQANSVVAQEQSELNVMIVEFNSHHRVVAFYLLRGPYFHHMNLPTPSLGKYRNVYIVPAFIALYHRPSRATAH